MTHDFLKDTFLPCILKRDANKCVIASWLHWSLYILPQSRWRTCFEFSVKIRQEIPSANQGHLARPGLCAIPKIANKCIFHYAFAAPLGVKVMPRTWTTTEVVVTGVSQWRARAIPQQQTFRISLNRRAERRGAAVAATSRNMDKLGCLVQTRKLEKRQTD